MTTNPLKSFSVRVTIMAHNEEDLIERMQDTDNPIESWIDQSIEETGD